MGKKKKIRRLVDAVAHLFATPPDRKKLRKASAFEQFLEDLRQRRHELAVEYAALDEVSLEARELAADVELVDAQIAKAERLLAALRED